MYKHVVLNKTCLEMWQYISYCIYARNFEEKQNSSEEKKIKLRKCLNMQFSGCCQACKMVRRCFLAWIFTSAESPLTAVLTSEIGDGGVLAALVQKGWGGHPGVMSNSIFCTVPLRTFSIGEKCFITLLHTQVMQQAAHCSSKWDRRGFI